MFYTGLGSRSTPITTQVTMSKIAQYLNSIGYTLRSGGADGADSAFESQAGTLKEIYLLWKGFNSNNSPFYPPSESAYGIAEKYHPAWHRLSPGAKALMARNMHQVLGLNLDSPSDFTVCYTSDGGFSGGTGQALRLCKDLKVPIFNLFHADTRLKLKNFLLNMG